MTVKAFRGATFRDKGPPQQRCIKKHLSKRESFGITAAKRAKKFKEAGG